MQTKSMKKIIVSVLVAGIMVAGGLITAFAATATSRGPTYVAGGSSYINWEFESSATGYTWNYYRWNYASGATGVSITSKRAVKGANPREAYGRISATYQGSPVLSDSIVTWHEILNSSGAIGIH